MISSKVHALEEIVQANVNFITPCHLVASTTVDFKVYDTRTFCCRTKMLKFAEVSAAALTDIRAEVIGIFDVTLVLLLLYIHTVSATWYSWNELIFTSMSGCGVTNVFFRAVDNVYAIFHGYWLSG